MNKETAIQDTIQPPKAAKDLMERQYFNVILIKNNKIEQNHLFSDKEQAERIFVNLVMEFCEIDFKSEKDVNNLLQSDFFEFRGGSISLSAPDIKMT